MRIAYLVHLNMGVETGVFKKILGQSEAWKSLGNEVKLFLLTGRQDIVKVLEATLPGNELLCFHYSYGSSRRSFFGRLKGLSWLTKEILLWKPDILYTRQDKSYPQLLRLGKTTLMILEINTLDLGEMWLGRKTRWFIHKLTRGFLIRASAGLVFVSYEIAKHKSFNIYQKPFVVIGNGIVLEDDFEVSAPPSEDIRLVFLGQPGSPWHGVDKIIDLAEACPDWRFDLIGLSEGHISGAPPKNLVFHGPMLKEEYSKILLEADCGIGSLALHRIHVDEISPLKTREYLAFGLPVIIAYQDTDFLEGAEFILQLPNTEDNISGHIPDIRSFVEQWRGRRVPKESILHLSMIEKERLRICFFNSLLNEH